MHRTLTSNPLLRVALILIPATLIWLSVASYFGNDYSRSDHVIRAAIIFATIVPLVLIFWKLVDKRSLAELHLYPTRQNLRDLVLGMLCWLIPASVGVAGLLLVGGVQISTSVSAPELIATFALLVCLVFIYEAFPEELLFRGYIFTNLAKVLQPTHVVAAQAVLFALWGLVNGGENSLDRTLLFLTVAAILGWLRTVTGNFWVCVGFHLAFQTAAQFLGDVGGQFTVVGLNNLMVIAFVILPVLAGVPVLRRLRNADLISSRA